MSLPNAMMTSVWNVRRVLMRTFLAVGLILFLSLTASLVNYEGANFLDLIMALKGKGLDKLSISMMYYLALPRVLMAILAGIAIAISGCLLQQSLQNDFASPSTLGVNVGAMVATVTCGVFAADFLLNWPVLVAFSGAILTATLVYGLAKAISPSPINLILVGMAVSLALGAVSAAMLMMFEGKLDGFYIWGAGNLAQADFSRVKQIFPQLSVLSIFAFIIARHLDFFALGDRTAMSLGLNVGRLRFVAVLLAILLASIVVSSVGIIAFIGLITPHIARSLGAKTMVSRLLWASFLGIVLLLLADITALFLAGMGYLVPAGAITTLVGAPFMISLLRNNKRQIGQQHENNAVGISAIFVLSPRIILGGLILLLLAMVMTSLSNETPISISLPRLLVAAIAGLGLAVSGLILQILLRNPLASPDVAGLTSSGILAVILVNTFLPLERFAIVIVSLIGTFSALLMGYLWLRKQSVSPQRWALMGVCWSAFCGTGVTLVMSLSATQSSEALLWLSGATYGVSMQSFFWLLPLVTIVIVMLLGPWRWLNLLQLGMTNATSLGLSSLPTLMLVAAVVLFCALSVSVVGGIAFVGLIAPHLIRALGVANNKILLPATAMIGALLLMIADYLSMHLMAPFELPSGLLVSVIGGLYFIVLLMSGKYAKAV